MEPPHVFYKKLPLDENKIFSTNLSENNAVTGLSIKQEVQSDLVLVADLEAQNALSDLIKKLCKEKRRA